MAQGRPVIIIGGRPPRIHHAVDARPAAHDFRAEDEAAPVVAGAHGLAVPARGPAIRAQDVGRG